MKDHSWQLVSLKLARRMKQLGFAQESLWVWTNEIIDHLHTRVNICKFYLARSKHIDQLTEEGEVIPAYTVAELGEMLPSHLKVKNAKKEFTTDGIWEEDARLVIGQFKAPLKAWYCDYHIYRPKPYTQFELYKGFKSDTEANARAKMLIYLKEKGLI